MHLWTTRVDLRCCVITTCPGHHRQLRAWPIRRSNRMRIDRIGRARVQFTGTLSLSRIRRHAPDIHGEGAATRIHELKACAPCAPRANSRSSRIPTVWPTCFVSIRVLLALASLQLAQMFGLFGFLSRVQPSPFVSLFLFLSSLHFSLFIMAQAPPRVERASEKETVGQRGRRQNW